MTEILRGIDNDPEPVDSVPVLLKKRALNDPDGVLIQDVSGRVVTNGAFHARALRIADGLAALGVKPGDCVVTLNDARLEAYPLWIGISWLGAMEVPVNPEFKGNSLIYGISDCRASVIVTSSIHLAKVAAIHDQLPHVRHVVTLDSALPDGESSAVTLDSVIATAPEGRYPEPTLSDPYAVIYTSGTTGPSKGVVVPWGSLQYAGLKRLFFGDDATRYPAPAFYSPWPMFHSSGRTGLCFAAMRTNGRFILRERLSVAAFWDDIRKFNCTHAHLLGVADFLYVQPAKSDDADNPLQRVLMNPVLADHRGFEDRFGCVISTGWGMTEIGFPMAAVDLPDPRTCGTLSDLYEARIVDASDNDVPDGGVGQLIIRPLRPWLLLKEYLGKPEATAKSWRNGWFYTGDALRRQPDGYYYFVDRVADYLRVRGNNVSSLELEAEVRAHPAVREAAAIGVSASSVTPSGGAARAATSEDEIKIVVQPREGASLTEAELMAFLIPRLPRFMVPRFVEFADDLPRTPTGKIQKKLLRADGVSSRTWDRVAHGIEVPR